MTNDSDAVAGPLVRGVGRPGPERAMCSVAVLMDLLPREYEIVRREVSDANGALVAVELWRGHACEAAWSGELDRRLAAHPAVMAHLKTANA